MSTTILKKVNITFTDQDGTVLNQFTTEGWDLNNSKASQAIAFELRSILDRIVARFGDDYVPWMYAKEVMEYTDSEIVRYPDGIALVRKAESIAGFYEFRFTPVLDDYDAIESWCKERIGQFRQAMEAEEILPDTTTWAPDPIPVEE